MSNIKEILSKYKSIAMIGVSNDPTKASTIVMKYMQKYGFKVFPVNPKAKGQKILGEEVYAKITDIKNLKYKLKREGYYWSDIYDHTNSKETFLSIHKIKTNSGAPLHIHENEEIIFVIKGSIEVKIGRELINVKKEQVVLIPQKTEHSLNNTNKEEAKIAIIFATNNPFSKTKYLK